MFSRGFALSSASMLVAAFMGVAVAAPAAAATAQGTRLCTGTRVPQLAINSSGFGSGSWTNYDTAQTSPFSFPGGFSRKDSPYQRVSWLVSNGSNGFYYSPPSATCV